MADQTSPAQEQPNNVEAIRNRVRGALLGLAAGDRNGGPIRMALRLAKSLVANGKYDREDVISRYFKWFKGPPHDTEKAFDTGVTFSEVFKLYQRGIGIDEAARRILAQKGGGGINAAHRSTPLACLGTITDQALADILVEEATITHPSEVSIEASVVSIMLVRHLIRGLTLAEALAQLPPLRTPEISGSVKRDTLPKSNGGYAPDVLQAALHFVANAHIFSHLQHSLVFAGPSNFCPVLVGALLGARFGATAIPADELTHIPANLLAEINSVADALAETWA